MSFPISPAVAVREIDLTLSAVEEISSLVYYWQTKTKAKLYFAEANS